MLSNIRKRIAAKLPIPFNFYRMIFNNDHLHFGYWPNNLSELSIEQAQQNMFEYLISFFPDPPAKILDVGCGLGLSACLLSKKGYDVTAIAPSSELIEYANQKYKNNNLIFHNVSFFDDNQTVFASESYDIILFQEAMQYLSPLEKAVKKVRYLLKDGGLIIVGDELCHDPAIKKDTAVHMAKDLMIKLYENGFCIIKKEDITNNVLPTCDFIIKSFTKYFNEIVAFYNKDKYYSDKLVFFSSRVEKTERMV